MFYGEGDKPLEEFDNKCEGVNRLWELSEDSGNEFGAVLTKDGAILITQQLGTDDGEISGIYNHEGDTYYQYESFKGATSRTYEGQKLIRGRYYIPIVSTMHSHTPCVADGTNGISNNTITEDQAFADKYPNVNHFIIGCNAIGQFNERSDQAFNVQQGNLTSLCNNIN